MGIPPPFETLRNASFIICEFGVCEDSGSDVLRLYAGVAIAGSAVFCEEVAAEIREDLPVVREGIDICVGDAAVEVCVEVVEVFRVVGVYVARDIEVIGVGRVSDFCDRDGAGVSGGFATFVKDGDDFVDVLCAESVLVSVLEEASACVHHEDTFSGAGVFFVYDEDTGGDSGTVEKVGREADDACDETALDKVSADVRLFIAAEEDTVR